MYLVHNDEVGRLEGHRGEGHARLLPARELRHASQRQLARDRKTAQVPPHCLFAILLLRQFRHEAPLEVLQRAKFQLQLLSVVLREECKAGARVALHLASGRLQLAQQQLHQGRLTNPICADHFFVFCRDNQQNKV